MENNTSPLRKTTVQAQAVVIKQKPPELHEPYLHPPAETLGVLAEGAQRRIGVARLDAADHALVQPRGLGKPLLRHP